jgi:predicted membrane protein
MENSNINNTHSRSNRALAGLILLIIGLGFLLRNMGFYLPDWLFSWSILLMIFGFFIGIRRNFRGGAWLVLIIIGFYFTLQKMFDVDISRFYLPLLLTAIGLYLIMSPKRHSFGGWRKRPIVSYPTGDLEKDGPVDSIDAGPHSAQDTIDSVNVFSGAHHNVFSKNLKGGDVVAVFGGCDLNLTQADFQGTIVLEVVAIFGGVKIIIPPTWKVKSELTAVFGGMEDKTSVMPFGSDSNRLIIIRGLALFGGVDIRNF